MDAKILVVDDDSDILEMIETSLRKLGYSVVTATDVAGAAEWLAKEDFDVMITDKNIPGGDGERDGGMYLLNHLRRARKRPEVLMITGYATIETAIEAMRLGAFDYICKPFALEVLREKVDRIVQFKQFLNPDNTLQSFKAFHNELLTLFEDREQAIDQKTDRHIKSILSKVEYFFRVQKEREKIMITQRDALAQIAGHAEELREQLTEKGGALPLLDRICTLAGQRF